MNMKKLLATGLIATVAMASTEASAGVCTPGGFYIQLECGVSMTKVKYKNNLQPQYGVLKAGQVEKMRKVNIAADNGEHLLTYALRDIEHANTACDATKTSAQKRKNLFQFGIGFGIDKRLGDVMLGVEFNFGKNCGNVKKKEKGLVLTSHYPKVNQINEAAGDAADVINAIQGPVGAQYNNGNYANFALDVNADAAGYYITNANQLQPARDRVVLATLIDNFNQASYDPNYEAELKCRNKFYIGIMPRIGCMVNPNLELYVTAGVKIRSDTYKFTVKLAQDIKKKETVTKWTPSFGCGMRYNFTTGVFAKLEYNYNLKAKKTFKGLSIDNNVKHTLQNASHDIKFGLGYRF